MRRPDSGGSSPLARGLLRPDDTARPRLGIIPARAGFTISDHTDAWRRPGSSPLARGLRSADAAQRRGPGIIPARAGFTPPPHRSRRRWQDHPRSRGVYDDGACRTPGGRGSSPLARGLPARRTAADYRCGIIPARAGFTGRGGRSREEDADHPRSRGVYYSLLSWADWRDGSSPLARGLPLTAQEEEDR